ncbi:hypothetical protein Acr_00g0002620 [Actinidia rufa]|uniref:Uncharacterized protein n=1 Tax=Actinidia rufa TaxID=165716 RepID=A0A7J0D8C3_9ERIC|nr:hypothetical protein Acr_00g0002620 [Actinidia rufa]
MIDLVPSPLSAKGHWKRDRKGRAVVFHSTEVACIGNLTPHEHYRDFDIPDLVLSPESEPGTRKPELHICSKQATCSRRCHPRSALSTISSSVTNLRLSPRVITKLLWPKNPNLKVDFLTCQKEDEQGTCTYSFAYENPNLDA